MADTAHADASPDVGAALAEDDVIVARPHAHITAPRNWLNDPNGPIRHGGRWHVFYQYNPVAPQWGPPSWGHVSSSDLVHWTDHDPALEPRPDGPDRDGCWSGCARVINGRPMIFYTGVVAVDGRRTESVCVARGSQDLLHWEPGDRPLIATAPVEITGGYHRDPFVFGEPGAWKLLLGSGLFREDGRAGAILQYTSEDLERWTYRGVLIEGSIAEDALDAGPVWECPQLFRSGDDYVLVYSVQMEGERDALRHCVYSIGRLTDAAFEPRVMGRLDYGNVFYAAAIASDDDGRVLHWGWVQEKHDRLDVDHSGALSLPRVIEVSTGTLRVAPAPELAALRHTSFSVGSLAPGDLFELDRANVGDSFELEFGVLAGSRSRLSLRTGGRSIYDVVIDEGGHVAVVTSGAFGPFPAPLPQAATGVHALRLFVDGSLIELFIDNEVAVTTRCYEQAPDAVVVSGPQGVVDVRVHGLDAAFSDR